MKKMVTTSVCVPKEMLERADKLIPSIETAIRETYGASVTRSFVLRLALVKGLESLEQDHKLDS